MKRIIWGIVLAVTYCTLAHGANRTVTEKDEAGNKKRVIELRDTVINGQAVTDTLSILTYENSTKESREAEKTERHENSSRWNRFSLNTTTAETIIAVTAIVFIFGLPALIVLIIFFFRYKNRKARYRLAEQALASGQPLPESFFKEFSSQSDIRSKGISNIFVGIGLFIFLWAITGEFGLGCIGLLIMFTGFGQLVIYYTQPSNSTGIERSRRPEKEYER